MACSTAKGEGVVLKERNANGSEGGYPPQSARDADLRQALVARGIADERIDEVLAQLDVLVAAPHSGAADGNGSANGNGASPAGAALSENARIILEQRYLMKGDDGVPVEEPDGLFHRVSNAVAQGEKPEVRQIWAGRFYDLMTSLKFLPNSPTLVNAGTGGRGCLSACFVDSPDDNHGTRSCTGGDMKLPMIESAGGGGIGLGSLQAPPQGATSIGDNAWRGVWPSIAVLKMVLAQAGRYLHPRGVLASGAHMAQLHVSTPGHPGVHPLQGQRRHAPELQHLGADYRRVHARCR